MKANKVIPFSILIFGWLVLLWSLMVSPYKFEWDPILREKNELAIKMLRLLYSFLLLTFGTGLILARMSSRAWVKGGFAMALVIVFFKLLEVFSL